MLLFYLRLQYYKPQRNISSVINFKT